jgi:hypothetical protein
MIKYRLCKLNIEGFRIYAQKTSINVFKNLTVIYGRNGRGKTTFQDALSWLFNDDIPRYSEYNREWTRVKNSHIRSLIYPDIPTSITADLEEVDTHEVKKIHRDESGLICDDELMHWVRNSEKKDALWANALSQSKLQELALAKGRERLENLAPLLDLTEIINELKDVESSIKTVKEQIYTKESITKKVSEDNNPNLLEEVKNINGLIKDDFNFIQGPVIKRTDDIYKEIDVWEVLFKNYLEQINKFDGSIAVKMKDIESRNFDISINSDFQLTDIEVAKLERELEKLVGDRKNISKKISKLTNNKTIVFNDIVKLKEYTGVFREIDKNITQNKNVLANIQGTINKHNYLDSEISRLNSELINIDKEITKCKKEKYILTEDEKNIQSYLKEYNKLKLEIENTVNMIKDSEAWLDKNENINREQLLEELENKLKKIGGNNEKLIEKKRHIDEAFSIFENYVGDGICPFCGIEHKSNEQLINHISAKKANWSDLFFQLGEQINGTIEHINSIRNLNTNISIERNNINNYRSKLEVLNGGFVTTKGKIVAIFETYGMNKDLILTKDLIDILIQKNNFKLNEASKKILEYNNIFQEKDKEKRRLQFQKKEDIARLNKTTSIINDLSNDKRNIVNKIKLVLKKYDYTFNQIGTIDYLDELNIIVKNLDAEIEAGELNIASIRTRPIEFKLYAHYHDKRIKFGKANANLKKGFELINALKSNLNLLDDKSNLEKEITKLKKELADLKNKRSSVRERQKVETNREIGKLSRRISIIFEMLSDVSPWKTIKPYAIVPDQRERTNLIFRPIPKTISTSVERYIEQTNSNSTFAFSGGQLSLLGLAIFLSQVSENKASGINNKPYLDTLLLDDPIQMMDTLRDDALVSLLCDIARDRQLIISTSDINFANKLILASRPIWNKEKNSCGVLHYEQLRDEGPEIISYQPNDWIVSQRIYLPKIREAK